MIAAQSDLRLNLLLPLVEIVLHFAREDLAELGVHAADVRGQRVDDRREDDKRDGCKAHALALRAARAFGLLLVRNAPTASPARSISPCGKPSFARRLPLAPRHLSLVGLVIVTQPGAAARAASAP